MTQQAAGMPAQPAKAAISDKDPAGGTGLVGMPDARRHEPAAEALAGGGMFATPDGNWICEGTREFFFALGDPDPDYDASLFAVKNLGFIGVRVFPKLLVEIALHPRNVTSAALFSVLQRLPLIQSDLIRISYLKERWLSETTSSLAQTICRLSEICAQEGLVEVIPRACKLDTDDLARSLMRGEASDLLQPQCLLQ